MGASDLSLAGGLALERGAAPPRAERRSAPTLARGAAADTAPAAYQPAGRSPVGIAVVIGLHLLLGYALVSGLAREVVNVIKAPIETRLIEEVKPPPPPPEALPPPTRRAPPPPPFAPPPEVVVAPPVVPTITTTQVAPPPTPVAIAPPDAPPAPPARPAGRPARIDVSSCDKPPYPDAAARAGATGITKIRFTVDAVGSVASASVDRSSGATREHRLLDKAAVAALSKCRFTPGTDEHGAPVGGFAVVDYQWQID
jgi:periplasmic protein TonB